MTVTAPRPRAALAAAVFTRAALTTLATLAACGGQSGSSRATAPRTSLANGAGRPVLSVVERQGDGLGAVAIAVTTEGIAPERGAVVAVALGALVQERLAARGRAQVDVVSGWSGWRLRALVESPADAAKLLDAARDSMLTPVAPRDEALPAVAKAVAALARRPLADGALADVARCTGEAYGSGDEAATTARDLEAWRRAAHGLGRVAIATAGGAPLADAVAGALARAPRWPAGAMVSPAAWPPADRRTVIYDASGEVPPGAARVIVTAYTTAPERAVAAAPALGDPRGALASRLASLPAPARIRSVIAAAHGDGGCVAVTLDLRAADLASDAPTRIATAAALARQELTVEIADVAAPADLRRALAVHASDPREAAERAAWWDLAGRGPGADELRPALTVGVAAAHDASGPSTAGAIDRPTPSSARAAPAVGDAIVAEIDRAATAWHTPVVEARTRVERGQAEAWVLLASPCGTTPEAARDAGTGAAVAMAAAMRAEASAGDARIEPFVSADGIGVLAHGPARVGESSLAHARRLADLVGRAFAADALDTDRIARARGALLSRTREREERALAVLGGALAPGHPSWIDPLGTIVGLESSSDESILLRAATIRTGPLRVAVLANADDAQAAAAVRAVDRWVARTPAEGREGRSCSPIPTLPAPRAGTYAVEAADRAQSEAFLAVPLDARDEGARAAAAWLAAALDGPGGLLARSMGAGAGQAAQAGQTEAPRAGLARSWSANLVGGVRDPALVVHLVAADGELDAAVAQVRALLDRLRQGALREDDRARATAAIVKAGAVASLDPRSRAIQLWRGEAAAPATPSIDALRSFASANLRDEALVIVAMRPASADVDRDPPSAESKPARRESSRR